MRFEFLSREKDRVFRAKIGSYEGRTVKEKEDAVIAAEPAMRTLNNDFLIAQAMSNALRGMGDRFAQLEHGLKRPITLRTEEFKLNTMQSGVTQ